MGALPELIGADVDLVTPGDDDAFAAAVVEVVTAPRTVDAALAARIVNHTWADAAAQMVEIYRDVASA